MTGGASGFGKLISEKCAAWWRQGRSAVDVNAGGLNEVFDGIRASGFEGYRPYCGRHRHGPGSSGSPTRRRYLRPYRR